MSPKPNNHVTYILIYESGKNLAKWGNRTQKKCTISEKKGSKSVRFLKIFIFNRKMGK